MQSPLPPPLPPSPPPPPPPPPPAADEILGGDAGDNDTYEEEVEEVIEEIIEEEIEEIEEEVASGKDDNNEFSNLSDCDQEDGSQDMESKGLDGKMISHTPEEHEANKLLTHSVEGSIGKFKFSSTSVEQLTPEKEESYGNRSNYRNLNSDSHFDNAAHQVTSESATDSKVNAVLPANQTPEDYKPNCGTSSGSSNNEIQAAGIRRQSNVAGKDVVVVPVSKEPDALKYMEEIEQMGNLDGKKRTILSAPEGLVRSRPSDAGIDNGNKRPAIICDFYARGWCIKGSSCRFLHIKETSVTNAHTSKYTFKTSLPASEILPSHKTSSWMASSFDSGSSSLKGMTSYSESLLSGSIDFRTPKFLSLPTRSSFFGSEAAKPPLTNSIDRQSGPAQHRTKFIPYNWEASIPFRPSFCVSSIQGVTSGSLRNSSELLNLGDGTYSSCYTQGASILNATDMTHSKSGTGIAGPKCNDDKHSASSHDRNNGKVVENECYTHKLKLPIGADLEGNSVVDGQSGTAPKEDKPLDFAESHNVTRQSDVLGNRTELVTSRDKQKYAMASEQEEDVNVQKESEVLQHFRAALIDRVKELVKPIWREGRLSRDAHKIIVKKASDKVISTLQFNQIPIGTESTKLFFSSSRPKIMKLVEGYVDKYGKL